jgi:hypothetical protein
MFSRLPHLLRFSQVSALTEFTDSQQQLPQFQSVLVD